MCMKRLTRTISLVWYNIAKKGREDDKTYFNRG